MPDSDGQAELFTIPDPPDGVQVVNDRCMVRTQGGHRVVIVAGIVLVQYAVGDGLAEAHARVALVEQGWADQNDVARAFGCSARTVRREQARFDLPGRGFSTARLTGPIFVWSSQRRPSWSAG